MCCVVAIPVRTPFFGEHPNRWNRNKKMTTSETCFTLIRSHVYTVVFSDLERFFSKSGHLLSALRRYSDTLLPKSEVSLLRDGRPPIFQNLDVGGTSASPIPVAWDQLRAIRDRKESRMGMEDK